MKKPTFTIVTVAMTVALLAAALGGCSPAAPANGGSNPDGQEVTPAPDNKDETIVFEDASWATSSFLSHLAAFITDVGYGYDAKVTAAAHVVALKSLETGEIDVHLDVQVIQMQDLIEQLTDTGKVEVIGTSFEPVWLGWLVPRYMIDGDSERGIEPTMPDFEDVYDLADYWELFEDPEDSSKGRFVNSVPGWESETINRLKMEAYGLDEYYNVMTPGSDAALISSMYAAYEKGQPWLGYYYSPSSVLGQLDMYQIPEPEYDESLWNEESGYGCGYPLDVGSTVAATSLQQRAPEVREFLTELNVPIDILNEVLVYMQVDGKGADEMVEWFLINHEDVWTAWIPEDVAARVAASV